MIALLKHLLLVTLVSVSVSFLHAQTFIGGTIDIDSTLRLGDSPFEITSTLTINPGATLTIEPGVEVFFPSSSHDLIINGTLTAVGGPNDADSIIFEGTNASASIHGGGVHLAASSIGSQLSYVSFKHMGDQSSPIDASLQVSSSDVTIEHLRIDDSETPALLIDNAVSPIINNGLVISNSNYGVYIANGSPTIFGAEIYQSTIDGIYLASGSPIIQGNLIRDNSQAGIYSVTTSPFTIQDNIIESNNVGINNNNLSVLTLTNNTFTTNTKDVIVPAQLVDDINFDGNGLSKIYLSDGINVTENTTLANQSFLYELDGRLTVDAEVTLTLEPGVRLDLSTNASLDFIINGTLVLSPGDTIGFQTRNDLYINDTLSAIGTSTDSIYFIGTNSNESSHGGNVTIASTSSGSQLDYVSFEQMGDSFSNFDASLYLATADVTINNLRVNDSEQAGLRIDNSAPLTLGVMEITNSYYGVWIDTGSPTISGSIFTNNSQDGFYITGGAPTIDGNTISNNGQAGIYSSTSGTIDVLNNTISGNNVGLNLNNLSTLTLTNNTFTTNTKDVIVPAQLVDDINFDGNGLSKIYLSDGINVTENTTLANQSFLYELDGRLTVDAEVTLTLEPGVRLDLSTNASLDFIINGTLVLSPGDTIGFQTRNDLYINDTLSAIGTSTDSIYFIGTNSNESSHGGNVTIASTSSGSQLDYVSFEQMGDSFSNFDASLYLATADVTINNLRVNDSEQAGLRIDNSAPLTLGVMEITNSYYGVWIDTGSPTISGSIFTNNSQDGFYITGGAPTIDGNTISNSGQAGIYSSTSGTIDVLNTTISGNNVGLNLNNLSTLTLTNNTFTTNTKDVIVPAQLVDDINFDGNGLSKIYLSDGINVTENTTLANQSFLYELDGRLTVDAEVTLTLEPGVRLDLSTNASLDFIINGTLVLSPGDTIGFQTRNDLYINDTLSAIGTSTDSIYFIGTNSNESSHGGNVTIASTSSGSQLDYVSFEQMGDSFSNFDASLYLATADVTINNLRVNDSEQAGLRIDNSAPLTLGVMEITNSYYGVWIDTGSPTISGSIFTNNSQDGFYITGGAPTIDGNTISNNGQAGIYSSTSGTIDVLNNTISGNNVGLNLNNLSTLTLTNNTFTTNTKDVIVPAQLVDDINFDGNGLSKIYLSDGINVTENTTLANQSFLYELDGRLTVDAEVTLTLEPGVRLDLSTNASLDFIINGTLVLSPGDTIGFQTRNDLYINDTLSAIGTSTDSIYFIGTNSNESSHGGNVTIASTSSGSQLDYVSFEQMGDSFSNFDASLYLATADVTINNLRVNDSEQAGLRIDNSAPLTLGVMEITNSYYGVWIDTGSPTISGSIFTNNSQDGFYITGGAPTIDGNTISNNGQAGIYTGSPDSLSILGNSLIGNNVGIDLNSLAVSSLNNNIFSNNNFSVIVPTNLVDDIDFSSNDLGVIYLADGFSVTENTTIPLQPWKYQLELDVVVDPGVTLTIDPGVELWFDNPNNNLFVNGTLNAVGNATDSIFFKGISPNANIHGGQIELAASSTSSIMDYISIDHMGDSNSPDDAALILGSSDASVDHIRIHDSERAGLMITDAASPVVGALLITDSYHGIQIVDGSPTISNATITGMNQQGIFIQAGNPVVDGNQIDGSGQAGILVSGTAVPTISNNTISNNDVGLNIDNLSTLTVSSNVFSGNIQDLIIPTTSVDDIDFSSNNLSVIHLASAYNVDVNTTLSKQTWNYRLVGVLTVDNGATLTIDPGVHIEFLGTFDDLIINGTLNAVGTETDSIYFTGVNAGPSAHGGGVKLSATSTGSLLNYVSFDHMGDANSGGASLYVNTANASIENLRIHDSEISGLELNGVVPILGEMVITSSNNGLELINSDVTIINSRFTNNLTGILVNEGNPVFRFCAIEGNSSSGINNTGAGTVDAINNWWGSTTGPTNGANPGGSGDVFTGNVLFNPFLGVSTEFSGTGLAFDGIDDYVEISDDASLDITGAITLETWVRFDEPLGEETPLISKWNPDAIPQARSYTLFLNNTNEVWMAVSTDGTTTTEGTNFSYHNVPYPFEVGKWYHIAGTFSPSSSIALYINGQKIGQKNFLMVPSIHSDIATLNLGSNSNTAEVGPGSVSTGVAMTMDEVRIWSEARDEGAIRNTMFTPLTGNETNLTAYYDLNESSGISVTDLTANANSGTLFDNNNGTADGITAGPLWSGSGAFTPLIYQPTGVTSLGFQANWLPIVNATNTFFDIDDNADFSSPISLNLPANVPTDSASVIDQDLSAYVGVPLYLRMGFNNGEALSPYSSTVGFMVQPGNALDFDGNDDVTIQNVPFTGNFTIETWFKTTQTDGLLAVINQNDQAINTLTSLSLNALGQVEFLFREPPGNIGGDSVQSVSTLNNDQWHHVAGVYDGLNLTLYVDGVQEGQLLTSAGGNYVTDISLGKNFVDTNGQYIGQLDEFRVWNVARTEAEIQEVLYTSLNGVEDGLVAYYTFDQGLPEGINTGIDSLIDQSGNTYLGTLNGFALTGTTSNWVTSGAQQSTSPPVAPTNLQAYSISDTEIQLEWSDNSTEETSFLIERANDYAFSSGVNSIATLSANSTSHVFNAGTDRSYFFRVTAQNGFEDGTSQSPAEFGKTGGFPGYSLQFDGVDDYVQIADNTSFQFGTGDFTIEAWIYYDGTSQTGAIVGKRDPVTPFSQIQLRIGNGFNQGAGNQLEAYVLPDARVVNGSMESPEDRIITAASPLTVGWHHVALVEDYDTDLKLYLDGILVGTDVDDHLGKTINVNANDLLFGMSSPGTNIYTGVIDEVKIWGRPLTEAELIEGLYNQPSGNEEGLIAYYSFDENGGLILTDETPGINNGNLVGGPVWQLSEIPFQFTVTSTNDSGPGTLRQALMEANASSADTVYISFDLAFANDTIKISSEELPALSGYHLILDGTTQTGWDFATGMLPTIKDDGCENCDGIKITGGSAEIYGLRIDGFDNNGIDCFIPAGPLIVGAPNKGNIIVNNGNHGVFRQAGTDFTVQGNYIGIDWNGNAFGNSIAGIFIGGGGSPLIGGLGPGERNVISGNGSNGFGKNTTGNVQIIGNYIGTDPSGTTAVPNGSNGIFLGTVGHSHDIIGNIISGNENHGIHFQGNNQDTVKQNKIGVNINGDPLGNGGDGILFGTVSSDNLIGGPVADANIIAYNGENGIRLSNASSISNFFLSNEIYGNELNGILMLDPATNAGIVPPTIEAVTADQVSGTGVDGHRIQLFLSDGSDQAIQFLDSADVSGGQWTVSGLSLVPGERVVATATDLTNGTSEFSYQYLEYPDSIPPGSALAFDGVNDYVTVPDNSSLDFGSDNFTVEYWVRKNATATNWSNVYGVSKWNNQGGNPGGNEWNLNIGSNVNDDNPVFVVEIGTNAYAATADRTLTVGEWYHLAGVKEGNQLRIYINGELVGSQGGASGSINNVGRSLNIGRNDLNSFFYSNADFDEVRIWRTALDQQTLNEWKVQEVNDTHPTYDQLVSYFQFDEGIGDSLYDVRNSNDGRLYNMAADDWIESGALDSAIVNDNALNFDGIDDYVDLGSPAELSITGEITLEAWVNIQELLPVGQVIASRAVDGDTNADNIQYLLRVLPSGNIRFTYEYGAGLNVATDSDIPIQTGTWTHVAAVRSISGPDVTIELFIDGLLAGSQTVPNLPDGGTNGQVWIGRKNQVGTEFPIKGMIDELRIWNTARTQSDIQSTIQTALTGDESGLLAYYPFNQGFADADNSAFTTLPDRSQNSFTGTLNNFALNGTTSNWVSSGGFSLTPAPPTNLTTTEISDSQVNLTWEDSSFNETDFAIFRSIGDTSSFVEIGTVGAPNSTTYSDNSVSAGNNYFYFVAARNGSGDSSPSNIKAAATFTPPGNALTFDGSDDHIAIPHDPAFTPASVTVETWVKVNSNTFTAEGSNSNLQYVVHKKNTRSTQFEAFSITYSVADAAFNATVSASTGTTVFVQSNPINVGEWYHLALVANSTEIRLYLNGQLQGTNPTGFSLDYDIQPQYIGSSGDPSFNGYLNGVVDEVRIWNTARTEGQIQSTVSTSLVGDESGLISYYKFDQTDPAITILPDRSTNQNDGTLINFGGAAQWTSDGPTFTVDTIPPVVTVDIIETNVVSPELTGTVDDPSSTIDVTVNAETVAAINNGDGTWTLPAATLSNLAEGTYEVAVSATDSALNVGIDSTANELIIDLTAPVITVNTLNTSVLSPEITGTVNDPTASVDITVNGETVGAVNNGDGTWTLTAGSLTDLAPGIYNVDALANDDAGNTASDVTTNELNIDTTPPTVTVNTLVTNIISPELSGTIDDADATIDVTINGETIAGTNNGDGTWTLPAGSLTALTPGTYEVEALATDNAGNTATDATSNELIVDDTAPTVSINSLVTNSVSPELTGTTDDPDASIELTVNGETLSVANNGDGTWTLPAGLITNLPEGIYEVSVTATDLASNSATDATSNELEIDLTAPGITVDTQITAIASPGITGTVDDPTATLEVTVNGETVVAVNNGDGTWQLNAGNLTDLPPATYDVAVTGTDVAGNTGSDATIDELIIDNAVPTITVNVLVTNNTSPELTGTIDDPDATISITVNAETISGTNNGDGTWTLAQGTLTSLPEGSYNVQAEATDLAGNTGTDGTTSELQVDITAPTVTVDPTTTNVLSPLLTGTIDDPAALIEITVNGETVAAQNNGDGTWTLAPGTLTTLSAGTYEVLATATDAANNAGTDGTSNELQIDDTPPTVTVNPLLSNNPSPELTGSIDDVQAGISVTVNGEMVTAVNNGDGTWTLVAGSLTSLPEGTYDVLAEATDPASNTAVDGSTNELTIDLTSPTATFDPLSTIETSPELTGTIDDPDATIQVTLNGNSYPATNNMDGSWVLTSGTVVPLAIGIYDITLDAQDVAGNTYTNTFVGVLEIQPPIDPGIELDSMALLAIYDQTGGASWSRGNNWRQGLPMSSWDDVELTLGRVTRLTLGSNNLVGNFPSITEGLDQLTDLDVSGNELVDIADLPMLSGLTSLDVSDNRLEFGSLEPVVATFSFTTYAPQKTLLSPIRVTREIGEVITIDRSISGTNNQYTWTRDGVPLGNTDPALVINITDFSDDGIYEARVTNPTVPSLTLFTALFELNVSSLERDSIALLAIYNALISDNSDITDWTNPDLTIDDWAEVTVENNRVTGVNLSDKSLQGSLPIDIIDIKQLETVDFSNNEIEDLPIVADSLPNLLAFDVSDNLLQFDDLVPNIATPGINYSDQKPFGAVLSTSIREGSSYTIDLPVGGGSSNEYQWYLTTTSGTLVNQPLLSGANSTYTIQTINYTNMGTYVVEVTNNQVQDLVLRSQPQEIQAFATLEFIGIGANQQPLSQGVGVALGVTDPGQPYDTVAITNAEAGSFIFDSLQLGDYVIAFESNEEVFVPTYFESTDLWEQADILEFRKDLSETLIMIEQPGPTNGEVTFSGVIEAEFISESSGRVLARRKVKKAGCSLRRRTRSGGGRGEQEFEYILYAYVQSDDNGNFTFNDIEDGYYRLNIEYPGIPMDESSFVEFQIGGEGLLGALIEVSAYITEEGIEIELLNGTGFNTYFKDLKVYPNPANKKLKLSYSQLSLDEVSVKLIDISGNVLRSKIIRTGYARDHQWDVSGLPSGLYILSFEDLENDHRQIGAFKVYIRH